MIEIHTVTQVPQFNTVDCNTLTDICDNKNTTFSKSRMETRHTHMLSKAIENHRFYKAINYINTHYTTNMTLDDIARMSGLSRYYFSRMFKREIGHSFKDYVNIKRLEAVKKLLQFSKMNISEACYSVGFNDASYFARLFKKHEGISPSLFRKQNT